MADDILKLDHDTERRLSDLIQQDINRGRFRLAPDEVFVLGAHGNPGHSDMLRTLKEKLPFIDFDNGGVKLLEFKVRGADARFTIIPRIEMPEGGKGNVGASVGLRFTVKF